MHFLRRASFKFRGVLLDSEAHFSWGFDNWLRRWIYECHEDKGQPHGHEIWDRGCGVNLQAHHLGDKWGGGF